MCRRPASEASSPGRAPRSVTERPVILYDAQCSLCTRSIAFVRTRCPGDTFAFIPLNSTEALHLLAGVFPEADTLILLDPAGLHQRSTAALRIAARLSAPWSWLRWLRFIPAPFRDAVYDLVARNRFRAP